MRLKRAAKVLGLTLAVLGGVVLLAFLGLVGAAKYYAAGGGHPDLEQSSVEGSSTEPHAVVLYDSGIVSLHQRLELIESARRSIELEFFIYNVDEASRLVTQALIRKAREGVRVRLLVDFSAPVFQLKPVYARFLRTHGIETRYYNTAAIYRLFSVQHRSHRKLLIIDDETVLTGGRNIGDEYFDLSADYNFLDSDLQVSGPIVKALRASFDLYWDSPLARPAENLEATLDPEELARASRFFLPGERDLALAREVRAAGTAIAARLPRFECRRLSFVTDFPDKGEGNRRVFAMISDLVQEARGDVWVETPYFVIKEGGYALLERARDNGARIKVLTNSLYSTDAFYTVAALYPDLAWLARTGMELHAYGGAPPPGARAGAGKRWGIHSKRAVVDGRTVLLGTYNVDPRSANLNSELVIVCLDNPDFAQAVLESIQERVKRSAQLMGKGAVLDEDALFGQSGARQKLYFFLAMPFASLFDFLL
jgi:putative cardiolipin synthase